MAVKPHLKKYSVFQNTQISPISIPIPSHSEGRLAIVTDAGRDAVDAAQHADERAASGRRSRVVLTPRRWCQVFAELSALATVANKPGHRGEHEGNRKTIVRGMPGDFRCDRGDCCHWHGLFFCPARLRAHWAPGIPCALSSRARNFPANLGRIAPRECGVVATAVIIREGG